jgi:hypothetical protein
MQNRGIIELPVAARVARFFLVQHPKQKNTPNDHKMYQAVIQRTKWTKSFTIFHSKIYQNLDFLVIWCIFSVLDVEKKNLATLVAEDRNL